jgi:hypothetical protein
MLAMLIAAPFCRAAQNTERRVVTEILGKSALLARGVKCRLFPRDFRFTE